MVIGIMGNFKEDSLLNYKSLAMKTVANILSKKGPQFNSLEAGCRVIDALSIMKTEEASFVIVTRGGKYAGLVTEHDYAQKVTLMNRSSQQTKIEEIMSSSLPMVCSDDSAEKCMMLMDTYKTRYLPVFDDYEFKAVITMNDLILINVDYKQYENVMEESSRQIF